MYYISFQNLIQEYVVPSSITCVNSMEMSYIPIAKARGFTTHWIKNIIFINFAPSSPSLHPAHQSIRTDRTSHICTSHP